MGNDGHIASLFPGADRLREALDPRGKARVLPLRAAAAGEPRLSLTLPALTATRALYLHIEGAAKRAVLEQALAATTELLPVATVVRAAPVVTQLYWCPEPHRSMLHRRRSVQRWRGHRAQSALLQSRLCRSAICARWPARRRPAGPALRRALQLEPE